VVMHGQMRFVTTTTDCLRPTVGRFANGELHAQLSGSVDGRDCNLVATMLPPADSLVRLTLVAHTLRRAGARRITALVPYLAYARQDRALPNESLGLAWVGELMRASGIDQVICVDIHSHDAQEAIGLPVTSLSPAALLAAAVPVRWRDDLTFVAPDEGAVDRCTELAACINVEGPVIWARKRRTAAGIQHLGLVGTPGRRAVIVDDILDTGATLVSCCRALRAAGVREIGIVVTHGLFTGDQWHQLLDEGVNDIWMTDTVVSRRRPPHAEVVPVAPLLTPLLTPTCD
jgi:ribose-phosphate pyrophosphokinase